jgi:hypothetical protein
LAIAAMLTGGSDKKVPDAVPRTRHPVLPPITRVLLRGVSSSDDAAPGGGSDATIDALDLHAPGLVPWWRPETRNVPLHRILIH